MLGLSQYYSQKKDIEQTLIWYKKAKDAGNTGIDDETLKNFERFISDQKKQPKRSLESMRKNKLIKLQDRLDEAFVLLYTKRYKEALDEFVDLADNHNLINAIIMLLSIHFFKEEYNVNVQEDKKMNFTIPEKKIKRYMDVIINRIIHSKPTEHIAFETFKNIINHIKKNPNSTCHKQIIDKIKKNETMLRCILNAAH